jgi:Antibiotic biosynthesis monooxygenase
MYVIIWEYHVKPARLNDFEKIYGESGKWVELFQKGHGYLGTELLHDSSDPGHYITIDRWISFTDYKSFLSSWKKEYENVDVQCESLTDQEILLGKWQSISSKTR